MLPIDEDVDDEKCSPIKPKRRTPSAASPFKKLTRDGNYEKANDDEVIDNVHDGIAVGGFGVELDVPKNAS